MGKHAERGVVSGEWDAARAIPVRPVFRYARSLRVPVLTTGLLTTRPNVNDLIRSPAAPFQGQILRFCVGERGATGPARVLPLAIPEWPYKVKWQFRAGFQGRSSPEF